ncbi:MAG: nitroreductase family protein [Actinomycetota bacterium]
MDVFDAVRTVLATRRYRADQVPEEVIQRIVEAGRLTGSGGNAQPWHFVVVTDRDTIQRMGRMLRTGPYVSGAPLAVVVAVDRSSRLAESDASRAIQSMILTAWGEGVGSNWVGFGGLQEVASVLRIPDYLDVLAVLPFGYPVSAEAHGRKARKAAGEIASREVYGQPFQ